MNSSEIAMPEPVPPTRTGRRARQKRLAADRSRAYREKLRAEGLPTARDADAAISEATSFLRRYALLVEGRPKIDLGDLIFISSLILKRDGKRKIAALKSVGERIALRDEHRQSLWMPSMKPQTADLLLPPEGGRTWTDEDLSELQAAIDRHFSKQTPSQL